MAFFWPVIPKPSLFSPLKSPFKTTTKKWTFLQLRQFWMRNRSESSTYSPTKKNKSSSDRSFPAPNCPHSPARNRGNAKGSTVSLRVFSLNFLPTQKKRSKSTQNWNQTKRIHTWIPYPCSGLFRATMWDNFFPSFLFTSTSHTLKVAHLVEVFGCWSPSGMVEQDGANGEWHSSGVYCY